MFKTIAGVFTKQNYGWIKEAEIPNPVILLKFLSMNPETMRQVNTLNKYAYYLDDKEFLMLAISIIPKYSKAPYNKYMKEIESTEKYSEVWEKIQNTFQYSDNDMVSIKKYLKIEDDIVGWFKRLGMDKDIWQKYELDYDNNKGEIVKVKSGLESWGL